MNAETVTAACEVRGSDCCMQGSRTRSALLFLLNPLYPRYRRSKCSLSVGDRELDGSRNRVRHFFDIFLSTAPNVEVFLEEEFTGVSILARARSFLAKFFLLLIL